MDIKETLKGLRTELIASHTLGTPDDYWKGHNDGLSKAVNKIDRYLEGKGLYQLIESVDKNPKEGE